MLEPKLPKAAIILGAAGLMPQSFCLILVAFFPEWRWLALSAACFYAAIILAFLGGLWWMQGLLSNSSDPTPYIGGVVPPILGWLALLPWCLGWNWPVPSLILLALALVGSPMVDQVFARRTRLPVRWMTLRWTLAIGLGGLSLVVGLFPLFFRP